MQNETLAAALALFDNSQTALAKALGVSPQLVSYWSNNGLPAWREPQVASVMQLAELEDLTPPFPKAV